MAIAVTSGTRLTCYLEQSPSLLIIILDTNPAAWSLLSNTLSLSSAVANLLVFINAHLACNYTNKVAVIASHCDQAQFLYPSPTKQKLYRPPRQKAPDGPTKVWSASDQPSESTKRLKINGPRPSEQNGVALNTRPPAASTTGNKYRPFRLVEEEVIRNLTTLLDATSPEAVSSTSSTMIAGALTLALSYINRESISHAESLVGTTAVADPTINPSTTDAANPTSNALQSRILLLSVSPSTDLAHQYIPIMNSIFACQRLSIPIDILQLPLPTSPSSSSSTVFLQQAADATHGIFISAQLPPPPPPPSESSTANKPLSTSASHSLLAYLLTAFLSSPHTRAAHLVLPTRIDVDFRAACFCHRTIVDLAFVCSICLSIFCTPPDNADCLTCGTHLQLGSYGARPVVVAPKKGMKAKKRQQQH